MARPKQKKKSASSSSSIDYKKLTLDQLSALHDADDESINEDEAFNSDDEELYGKYFHANSDDDDVSSDVRSKSYLGLTVPLFANDDDDDTNEEGIITTTAIKKGHKMTLSSLCLDIPSCNFQQIKLMVRCVYLGDVDEPWLCLGNFLGSNVPPSVPVSLEVVGPCRVEWKVEGKYPKTLGDGSSINIFGKIVPIFEEAFSDDDISVDYADAFMSEEEEEDDDEEEDTLSTESLEENADEKDAKSSKKRKLSIDNDASEGEDEPTAKLGNNGKLTKKERKRLAQEKAQQLEETLSAARKDGEDSNGKTSKKKKKKKKNSNEETTNETEELSKPTSLTRERRLPSGVTVRDLLVGTGAPVKSGKKISLHYTGSLLDNGKVFDKNHSKQHPLVFRQGTGEVIRGLERGLDGMKVGGERIINIPSKLGYGSKGAGDDIPPDSDLTFEVKLLRVG
jgi:FKBP-type peptidyl-prolyl cis-trans isomerase